MPSSTGGTSTSSAGAASKPVSYTHLAWSIGHIIVLVSTIVNLLGTIFFQSRPKAYSLAYGGAILSWSIVVYKSLGLSFIRTTFLPKVSSKKDSSGSEQPQQIGVMVSRRIQSWVKQNYESAMYCVAFIEVLVIQGRVTLGALTFQNSLLHPLFFAHFLRLRYYLSPQTRAAVSVVNRYIDHYVNHPSCPAVVKKDTIISTTAAHPSAKTVPQTPNSVNSNNRTPNSS